MISLIHPYYNHKETFAYQFWQWSRWSNFAKKNIEVIVVDDGSLKYPCLPPTNKQGVNLKILRIEDDILWNTAGAGNLGVHNAKYDWVMHVDFDLGLNPHNANRILEMDRTNPKVVYWPMTWHETSKGFQKYGKHHCNSYLMNKSTFWEAGGYDEDFGGCWGGQDIMFHKVSCKPLGLTNVYLTEEDPVLERMIRCSDATVQDVPRERELNTNWDKYYDKRDGIVAQNKNILRFKWHQVYP